jgi:hypothetical protein
MGIKSFKTALVSGLLAIGMLSPFNHLKAGEDLVNVNIISKDTSGSTFQIRHHPSAKEDFDSRDGVWSNLISNPNNSELRLQTAPYEVNLYRDARNIDSMTTFNIKGEGIDSNGVEINSSSNYITFQIVSSLATNRQDYLYNLKVFGTNDVLNPYFTEGGSMRDTINNNGSRIYGSFSLDGLTNTQNFLEMPFIPVSDSTSFFLDSGINGSFTNGKILLDEITGNSNIVNGLNGKYWTEKNNTLNLRAEGNLGYKPSYFIWNNQTNELNNVTSESTSFSLENVIGWSDGLSNRLQVAFKPLLTSQGTPYLWLYDKGLAPSNDFDVMAGGYKTWQHYQLDTDPSSQNNFFYLLSKGDESGLILKNTSTNVEYKIDINTNLLGNYWTPFREGIESKSNEITIPRSEISNGFYRVRAKRK